MDDSRRTQFLGRTHVHRQHHGAMATLEAHFTDSCLIPAFQPTARCLPSPATAKIDKKRVVTEEEGRLWAKRHGFFYFETSAYSGANVEVVFLKLFEKALAKMKET